MSIQRFTPELKVEPSRQVIERGYSVAETAERLGVSTHSLYKWIKAVTLDKKTRNRPASYSKPKAKFCTACPNATAGTRARHIKKAARYFARELE